MTISKTKYLLLLSFAMALPALAFFAYMDVPFGSAGASTSNAVPLSADAVGDGCDVPMAATEAIGADHEHDHDHGHDHDHDHDGGDSATNSGEITDAQFNDGGFGDIGQQWWNVNVAGPVVNVHISGNDNNSVVAIGEAFLEGAGSSVGASTPDESAEPSTTTTVAPSTTTTIAPSTTTTVAPSTTTTVPTDD